MTRQLTLSAWQSPVRSPHAKRLPQGGYVLTTLSEPIGCRPFRLPVPWKATIPLKVPHAILTRRYCNLGHLEI